MHRIDREPISRPKRRAGKLVAVAGGLLAAAGCGAGHVDGAGPPVFTVTANPSPEGPPSTPGPTLDPERTVEIHFDDRDEGSPVIDVYQGPSDSAHDRIKNGTYEDFTKFGSAGLAHAECEVQGRKVTFTPEDGGPPVSSTTWLRLHQGSGELSYAPALYVEDAEAVAKLLPDCP